MKASKMARNPSPEIEVYRDFMRLDRARRRAVAVRILRNQKILTEAEPQVFDGFAFSTTVLVLLSGTPAL